MLARGRCQWCPVLFQSSGIVLSDTADIESLHTQGRQSGRHPHVAPPSALGNSCEFAPNRNQVSPLQARRSPRILSAMNMAPSLDAYVFFPFLCWTCGQITSCQGSVYEIHSPLFHTSVLRALRHVFFASSEFSASCLAPHPRIRLYLQHQRRLPAGGS